MASKVILMTALFDQLKSCVTELSEMYPEDSDFPLFITTINLMKTTNPSLLAKYIYDNMVPYEEKIMSRDEQFFMVKEFSEYTGHLDMNIFGKSKQYYSNMTKESQESLWKYSENIIRLAKATHLHA